MKKNYIIIISSALFILHATEASAQWTKTSFPTTMPNKIFATSDGHILAGEYGKNFSETQEGGGLYVLSDYGNKWDKADVPDYLFTAFIEYDGYVYAFADGANIARSNDYKTWEMLSYAEIYDMPEYIQISDCYAAAVYKDRIYCAPFGCTPAYSENGGDKWILTDPEGLDPYNNGVVYLYGMKVFNDRLYAYGVEGIFRLNEDGDTWEMLQETYYASQSIVFDGKLYVTTDMMGGEVCMWETYDGDNWTNVEISREYTNENSIGSLCSVGNAFFIGSSNGIFYSDDKFETWNNVTYDFPVDMDFGDGYYYYVKPTTMTVYDNFIFAAGFNPFGEGGIYRFDASEFASTAIETADSEIIITDTEITVSGTDRARITVTTTDGKTVLSKKGTKAELGNIPDGIYIYDIVTEQKKMTGKFIHRQ